MRFLSCLLLLTTLAGCRRSLEAESAAVLVRAQQAFDTAKTPKDYLLVASLYQQLVDQGVESGAIFYNQGNAYMRGGQRGRAIACYRRAQRYRPSDPKLAANLQFALGTALPVPSRPLIETILFWQDWLSYPAKFQLSLLTAAVSLCLALVGLWHASDSWRKAAIGMLVCTFVLASSAIYDWYRFDQVRHAVIVSRETVARKGNDETYEPAFTAPLPEGTELTVVELRGQWLLVQLPSGAEGWVPNADAVLY